MRPQWLRGGRRPPRTGTSPSADKAARTFVEDVVADDVAAGTGEHGPMPCSDGGFSFAAVAIAVPLAVELAVAGQGI